MPALSVEISGRSSWRGVAKKDSCRDIAGLRGKGFRDLPGGRVGIRNGWGNANGRGLRDRAFSLTGLPHSLCRSNMFKVAAALKNIRSVLAGLTRGLPAELFDKGCARLGDIDMNFYRQPIVWE